MKRAGPDRVAGRRWLVLAVVGMMLAASCNQAGKERSAALANSEVVHFRSADGVRLGGRLFGKGAVGVVLSHMLPADQSSWYDFAGTLADQGFLALTYDFRGYCPGGDAGCSEGSKDIAAIWQDVVGAVRLIRSEGASKVILVGASMGGTASLVAATKPGVEPAAIVTLSAPESVEGLVADDVVVQQISAAKLFIAGEFDTVAAQSAKAFYDSSPLPKRIEILPTPDHGTDLLTGSQGEVVRRLILTYVQQYSASA